MRFDSAGPGAPDLLPSWGWSWPMHGEPLTPATSATPVMRASSRDRCVSAAASSSPLVEAGADESCHPPPVGGGGRSSLLALGSLIAVRALLCAVGWGRGSYRQRGEMPPGDRSRAVGLVWHSAECGCAESSGKRAPRGNAPILPLRGSIAQPSSPPPFPYSRFRGDFPRELSVSGDAPRPPAPGAGPREGREVSKAKCIIAYG